LTVFEESIKGEGKTSGGVRTRRRIDEYDPLGGSSCAKGRGGEKKRESPLLEKGGTGPKKKNTTIPEGDVFSQESKRAKERGVLQRPTHHTPKRDWNRRGDKGEKPNKKRKKETQLPLK